MHETEAKGAEEERTWSESEVGTGVAVSRVHAGDGRASDGRRADREPRRLVSDIVDVRRPPSEPPASGETTGGEAPPASADELLATFCHDLRSALSAIVMGSDFLVRHLPQVAHVPNVPLTPPHAGSTSAMGDVGAPAPSEPRPKGTSPQQSRKMAEAVHRAAKKMTRLLDDYHDLARINGHRLLVNPVSEDAGLLLAAAVLHAASAPGAPKSEPPDGPHVEMLPPEPTMRVRVDHEQMARAIGKLIQNAVAVTPASGTVSVSAEREGDDVVVRVQDSGPGIDPEIREHLFDARWLATRRARRGAGLGLGVARGIVEAHHGALELERTGPEGSSFRVTLPKGDAFGDE